MTGVNKVVRRIGPAARNRLKVVHREPRPRFVFVEATVATTPIEAGSYRVSNVATHGTAYLL